MAEVVVDTSEDVIRLCDQGNQWWPFKKVKNYKDNRKPTLWFSNCNKLPN